LRHYTIYFKFRLIEKPQKKGVMNKGIPATLMVAGTLIAGIGHAEPTKVPTSITTPDTVESRIGTLKFKDA
jgi:hypothetical protein